MPATHLTFVDDDPEEVRTFRRLYEGGRFRVTAVCAAAATDAAAEVARALPDAPPDLFVLDLYFPLAADAPTDLGLDTEAGMARRSSELATVESALRELEESLRSAPEDGKRHLRRAHAVAARGRALLDRWCADLGQSPAGGIQLLGELDHRYPRTPKAFYSRKATLADARLALAAGAVDVLSKPDPTREEQAAAALAGCFEALSRGRPPEYLRGWVGKVRKGLGWEV